LKAVIDGLLEVVDLVEVVANRLGLPLVLRHVLVVRWRRPVIEAVQIAHVLCVGRGAVFVLGAGEFDEGLGDLVGLGLGIPCFFFG